jgi:hypothetical protein
VWHKVWCIQRADFQAFFIAGLRDTAPPEPTPPAAPARREASTPNPHARREIAKRLADSPSLREHPGRYLTTAYRHAREDAADETGHAMATFPEACPWTVAQVLDENFWEDGEAVS